MTTGDGYRTKALEVLTRANGKIDSQMRAEFENLPAAFLRLAEQVERNVALTKIKAKAVGHTETVAVVHLQDGQGTLICPKGRIAP
jgi:hypothetical protein